MVTVDELFEGDIGDGEGVSEEWVRAHEADARQKVNVGAVTADSIVEDEEFLVPNHLRVDHVAEGVSTNVKSRQVSQMLSWEVKGDSVYVSPGRAPHLYESESNDYQDSIRRHHHDTASDVNDEKNEHKSSWVVLVLLHQFLNLVSVEHLKKDDEKENVADDEDGQNIDAKPIRKGRRVERVIDRMRRILREEGRCAQTARTT